jgi:hypothetical protein
MQSDSEEPLEMRSSALIEYLRKFISTSGFDAARVDCRPGLVPRPPTPLARKAIGRRSR